MQVGARGASKIPYITGGTKGWINRRLQTFIKIHSCVGKISHIKIICRIQLCYMKEKGIDRGINVLTVISYKSFSHGVYISFIRHQVRKSGISRIEIIRRTENTIKVFSHGHKMQIIAQVNLLGGGVK